MIKYLLFSCFTVLSFSLSNPAFDRILPTLNLKKASSVSGIDCIYLINLKRFPKRLARIDRLFRKHGIDYTRVTGVDGWHLFGTDERALIKRGLVQKIQHPFLPYNPGRLGCYLSHYMVYRDACRKGYQTIWILEDDVEIVGKISELERLLRLIEQEVPNWDVLYTYYTHPTNQKKTVFPLSKHFFLVKGGFFGGFSMIVSRSGMKRIYNYLCRHRYQLPIDCIAITGQQVSLCRVAPKKNIVVHPTKGIGLGSTDKKINER